MSNEDWIIFGFLMVSMASLIGGVVLGVYMGGGTLREVWRQSFLSDVFPPRKNDKETP